MARRPRSRCHGVGSLWGCEEELGPPSFWRFTGNLWCSLVYTHIPLNSATIVTWCCPCVCICKQSSPSYMDTSHTGFGPTLMSSSYYLYNNYLQIPSLYEFWGVRASTYLFCGDNFTHDRYQWKLYSVNSCFALVTNFVSLIYCEGAPKAPG